MKKFFIIIILSCLLAPTFCCLAQDNITGQVDEKLSKFYEKGLVTGTAQTVIGNVIKVVLGVIGTVALVMFVYGGISWMTAGGNPEQVNKAKNTLIWATLGLVLIFLSYAIVYFIISKL